MGPVFCFNKGFIDHLWGYILRVFGSTTFSMAVKRSKRFAVGTFRVLKMGI